MTTRVKLGLVVGYTEDFSKTNCKRVDDEDIKSKGWQ